MAIDKSQKPANLVPRSFGGEKNNFSDDLIASGYEVNMPQTYNGDNLNYQLDATGKELDYCEKVVDYINGLGVGKTPIVNANNKLDETQIGLKVYNATETYSLGEWVRSGDKIYQSLTQGNLGNDLTNETYWKEVKLGGGSGLENKITNCLLEVPQRIKLELNDGTLTLKAGSQVIVPNGFEADGTTPKFDYITIESDAISLQWGTATNTNISEMYNPAANEITPWEHLYSGSTAPTTQTFCIWYDTTNNLVKWTTNGGTSWGSGMALPLSLSNYSSGFITSINQVFNGMGYIGSTIWVDKGVKGLIPNGRNEDGSLKNIEFTINKFVSNTLTYGAQDYYLSLNEYGIPLFIGKSVTKYDSDKNVIIDTYANTDRLWCFAGECTADVNNKITSFSIKLPFRAVDYNDFNEQLAGKADISTPSIQAPYIKNTYVNGTSGYRIWSDGYCEQWGYSSNASTTVNLLKHFINTNYTVTTASITDKYGGSYTANIQKNTTNFISKGTQPFNWHACGYIS